MNCVTFPRNKEHFYAQLPKSRLFGMNFAVSIQDFIDKVHAMKKRWLAFAALPLFLLTAAPSFAQTSGIYTCIGVASENGK